MKKDLTFAPILAVIGLWIGMLDVTGLTVHILLSVLGLGCLIAYTVLAKKEWKSPALEILMRVCYGIALITGILVMNIAGVAAIALIHKISALGFVVLLLVLFVAKLIAHKKAKN